MHIDQLSLKQQESALYCHSCGDVHTEEELGECLTCDYRLCFSNTCSGRCACDDAMVGIEEEIDEIIAAIAEREKSGAGEAVPQFSVEHYESVLREIDLALSGLQGASA